MAIYWTLLAFSVIFYPICMVIHNRQVKVSDFRPVENKDIKLYFICVSVFMIVIIGLRGVLVGIDTWNYFQYFLSVRKADFSLVFHPDLEMERGYVFLEILAHKIHLGFAGFNLLCAIINVSIISYLIYKKSSMPWLSYFLYICFSFFVLELTMVRQTLAISFVVLAVATDKNKTLLDFLKFLVLILLARSFHASAIVALPLWFLRKIPYNSNTVFVALSCIVLAYLAKSSLVGIVQKYATEVSERYDGSHVTVGNMGLRLYAMVAVSLLPGIMIKRFHKERWNTFCFYCLCMMLVIFPAVQAGGALLRVYYYYFIFLIIYVPRLVTALDPKKDKSIKLLIVFLYMVVGIYILYNSLQADAFEVVPYKFFWEPIHD